MSQALCTDHPPFKTEYISSAIILILLMHENQHRQVKESDLVLECGPFDDIMERSRASFWCCGYAAVLTNSCSVTGDGQENVAEVTFKRL